MSAGPSREQRVASIQEAATRLICERGFFGFGMREVARDAALGVATLYRYVADKETLVYQVAERTLRAALASAQATLTIASKRDRLRALVTDHIRRGLHAPLEARLLSGAPLPLHEAQRRRIAALAAEYHTLVQASVDAVLRRKGERRAVSSRRTLLLLGMADRMALDATTSHPGARPTRLAADVLRLFYEGTERSPERG